MKLIRMAAITSLLISSGCATTQLYEGEDLPPEQVVTIKGMVVLNLADPTVPMVCKIDDEVIDGCASSVEFLPGRHKLLLKAKWLGMAVSFEEVEKEFVAGDVYKLGLRYHSGGGKTPVLIKERKRN